MPTVSGYIKTMKIKAGDQVSGNTEIAEIYNDSVMEVDIPFLSVEAAQIPVGSTATLTLSDTLEEISGTVTSVDQLDTTLTGGQLVRYVTVQVTNPGGLTSDMYATASINGINSCGDGAFQPIQNVTLRAGDLSGSVSVKKQLERVGLADKWMQHPAQLSGGQQQRVSIARALAGDPELILADEPTGALDTKTSRQVMGFLQDINQDGTTVVMITHDNALALGAKRRTILSQFVIEAAVTSSLGGFIGIAVGFVGTSAAGKIMGIDASPTFLSVLVSFMVSVMIGLIFGYLPARRAAALNPIDALRSD